MVEYCIKEVFSYDFISGIHSVEKTNVCNIVMTEFGFDAYSQSQLIFQEKVKVNSNILIN